MARYTVESRWPKLVEIMQNDVEKAAASSEQLGFKQEGQLVASQLRELREEIQSNSPLRYGASVSRTESRQADRIHHQIEPFLPTAKLILSYTITNLRNSGTSHGIKPLGCSASASSIDGYKT